MGTTVDERPGSVSDKPTLARPDEIARALSCSRSKVYELLQRDEIPGKVVIGSSIRVHRATFEAWPEQLATPSSAA